MTSEVLIMTPSAVAMAADSVVTINGNKTYEGVNKLFMLSKNPPMGIMIYNNVNFIAIPFETLIKDFREQIMDDETANTVDDFKNKFKEYLENEMKEATESIPEGRNYYIEEGSFASIDIDQYDDSKTVLEQEVFRKASEVFRVYEA